MTESTEYVLDSMKAWVWSGFYTRDDVNSMVDDILDSETDEKLVRVAIKPEFAKKAEAEKTWPKQTDCDRLDAAFEALFACGVLALHDAGYTMSAGHDVAREALEEDSKNVYIGYCFYHGQDLERAVKGDGLWIAFDHVKGNVPEKVEVGRIVQRELERVGFNCEWDGNVNRRIGIPIFDWKRRSGKWTELGRLCGSQSSENC